MTIDDGRLTVTVVDPQSTLRPAEKPEDQQATMLAGAYVPSWTRHAVAEDVLPTDLDRFVAREAAAAGIATEKPFVFQIEGEFQNVRIHVINGACPVHARIKNNPITAESKPYEELLPAVSGKLIGVYAKEAVGDLTQSATSLHAHLLFRHPESGAVVTAHVEQAGLREGAELRLGLRPTP